MAGASVSSRPESVRGLLSKAKQVLASDRCGISVRRRPCQRAGLVQREEMTWLSWSQYVFVPPAPRGQAMAGIQKGQLYSGRCYKPPVHPFHRTGLCTSWLLLETIRSPSVPSMLLPGMSSPSPNTTAVLRQRKVMNQNLILFAFARSRLLSQIWISYKKWGGGLKQELFRVTLHSVGVCLGTCKSTMCVIGTLFLT